MMNVQIDKDQISQEVILKAGKWLLTPYCEDDVDIIYLANTDPSITYFMGKEPISGPNEARLLIEGMIEKMRNKKGMAWVISNGQTRRKIGHVGFWSIDDVNCRAELGYALLKDHQRKGIMTLLFPVLLDYAFNRLKLHSVFANISDDNEGSRKLLERNGFKLEARFRENHKFKGKYIDSLIYTKLENE